tara:strand:+ start:76 stop:201 length:126 start_codon:yes stop_codon:yes gene_type:complete
MWLMLSKPIISKKKVEYLKYISGESINGIAILSEIFFFIKR